MSRGRIVPKQNLREAQASVDAQASDRRTSQVERKADKRRMQLQYVKPADAAAGSTLETAIAVWRRRVRVTRISLMGGAVTEHASNFAAFTAMTTPPRSSTTENVIVRNTKPKSSADGLGSWSAYQEVSIGEPSRIFEIGSTLILKVEKGGAGVQLPALVFVVEYEALD